LSPASIEDDVELVFLFSSSFATGGRASNSHSSGGRLDAFFFEKVVEFFGFQNGQGQQFITEFGDISHGSVPCGNQGIGSMCRDD
jgi:hypothetical protein